MERDFNFVCNKDMCAGCMLCVDICPVQAISVMDGIDSYNAVINHDLCLNCGRCHKLCPQNSLVNFKEPVEWYQGWSLDPSVRANSASGGMAAEISSKFIQNGGEVCTCVFDNGNFVFNFFDKVEDISSAAGSKYVKSNPHGIYNVLQDKLANGKKVLMIGLPCQIAAAKKYINGSNEQNFYTIDLVCHGTPSPELLRLYLKGKNMALEDINNIQFREKNIVNEHMSVEKNIVNEKIKDLYMRAYDYGMSYTHNCYFCSYARLERISDITLGDSWGSELSQSEKEKGISLVLCQTTKGRELLNISNAELLPVDVNRAINSNLNLNKPSVMPPSGYKFFSEIKRGKSFQVAMLKSDPIWVIKHRIKNLFPCLIRIKKKCGGGYQQYNSVSNIYKISFEVK